ncbi:MAG: OsmC family peroxiredoxin, partial [Deltaproteobacteria bacterium]|nr:OsmC family peroxiredoxin [Deltaproteobacteria bacterium]
MDLMTIEQQKNKHFTIQLRHHTLSSDMHKEDGGEDTGMNPIELLVGYLGAC